MAHTSDLTDRISELLVRSERLTRDELEEIAQYESDERITPVDVFNIGLVFHRRGQYLDALRCFGDALESYRTGEECLRICTYAYIGEAAKRIADSMFQSGDADSAIEIYAHAAKAYGHMLTALDWIPAKILPAALANAAVVFYNVSEYSRALQICVTYQTLCSIRLFSTEKTDTVIDTIFTKAGKKMHPAGKS